MSSPAVRWLHVYSSYLTAGAATDSVAPAPNGGVYGLSTLPGGKVTVRHLAANGSTLSKVVVGTDSGQGLASDATGFYVAWSDSTHLDTDALTLVVRKYNNAGQAVWTQRWGTPLSLDEVHGMAAGNGNVYVLYTEEEDYVPHVRVLDAGTGAVGPDWLVNADGVGGALAVNASAVYTVTDISNYPAPGTTVRLDRWQLNGTPVWHRQITHGTDDLSISGIALDPAGVSTAFWYPNAKNYEHMMVQRNTLNGDTAWSRSFPSSLPSQPAADGTGVYASWATYAGTIHGFDVFVRKLSLTGAVLWTARVGVDHQLEYGYSLVAGPKSVFVGAASGGFVKFPMVAALTKSGP